MTTQGNFIVRLHIVGEKKEPVICIPFDFTVGQVYNKLTQSGILAENNYLTGIKNINATSCLLQDLDEPISNYLNIGDDNNMLFVKKIDLL